jgi:ADP-ribose pyrophosphatase
MKPKRLAREVIYQSPWINLYLDKVEFAHGLVVEKYHLLNFPRAAETAVVENDIKRWRICANQSIYNW